MSVRILTGDCRDVLKTLPDESVHCVVTSPPYFGLRDYGTAKWEGGNPSCDHRVLSRFDYALNPGLGPTGVQTQSSNGGSGSIQQYRGVCGKCAAVRTDSQIGLELTPNGFVTELVAVFAEIRRVLRADGTVFLNLGDSYASSASNGGQHDFSSSGLKHDGRPEESRLRALAAAKEKERAQPSIRRDLGTLKPKDLIGIPWRVAFALQADGWWLRQDIIWSKPNPMPESVTDRCTKAHEYIFLLSKSERYHFDAEAIAEPAEPESAARYGYSFGGAKAEQLTAEEAYGAGTRTHPIGERQFDGTRNKRSVWTVTTQPFSEAHFATFPPALIEPCILAGCPKGGTVLDPFGGAGTTGLVADRLGRNAILIELNPAYAEMAQRRIKADAGMFAEVAAA